VRLKEALRLGTTHLEAKSGYGLTTESELKLLQVGNSISSLEALPTVDLTWLGAHATPKGKTYSDYTE
ncbi:MAG: imidazolonepropionase, partial [Euryarchaeota archaeon]